MTTSPGSDLAKLSAEVVAAREALSRGETGADPRVGGAYAGLIRAQLAARSYDDALHAATEYVDLRRGSARRGDRAAVARLLVALRTERTACTWVGGQARRLVRVCRDLLAAQARMVELEPRGSQEALVSAHAELGSALHAAGKGAAARRELDRAEARAQSLPTEVARVALRALVLRERAMVLADSAWAYDRTRSVAVAHEALSLQRTVEEFGAKPASRLYTLTSMSVLAAVLRRQGHVADALSLAGDAVIEGRALAAGDRGGDRLAHQVLTGALSESVDCLVALGRTREAYLASREALWHGIHLCSLSYEEPPPEKALKAFFVRSAAVGVPLEQSKAQTLSMWSRGVVPDWLPR